MYDSGGISLKPGDAVHATMKNDMSGAGACSPRCCRSASAVPHRSHRLLDVHRQHAVGHRRSLGDVMTVRGGTTVEIINTDAEGRLVMADALVLAAESSPTPSSTSPPSRAPACAPSASRSPA